jgi:hypothetical protein
MKKSRYITAWIEHENRILLYEFPEELEGARVNKPIWCLSLGEYYQSYKTHCWPCVSYFKETMSHRAVILEEYEAASGPLRS